MKKNVFLFPFSPPIILPPSVRARQGKRDPRERRSVTPKTGSAKNPSTADLQKKSLQSVEIPAGPRSTAGPRASDPADGIRRNGARFEASLPGHVGVHRKRKNFRLDFPVRGPVRPGNANLPPLGAQLFGTRTDAVREPPHGILASRRRSVALLVPQLTTSRRAKSVQRSLGKSRHKESRSSHC